MKATPTKPTHGSQSNTTKHDPLLTRLLGGMESTFLSDASLAKHFNNMSRATHPCDRHTTPDMVFILRLHQGPLQGIDPLQRLQELLHDNIHHTRSLDDTLHPMHRELIQGLVHTPIHLRELQGSAEFALELLMCIYHKDHFEHEIFRMHGDLYVFLVRWREDFLLDYAEKLSYPVCIDPGMLNKLAIHLDEDEVICTGMLPFRSQYAHFLKKQESDDGLVHEFFQSKDRTRMLWRFTIDHLNYPKWVHLGHIHDAFNSHCPWRLHAMRQEHRLTLKFGRLDCKAFQEYFGIQVGLYFAFLDYNYWWSVGIFFSALLYMVASHGSGSTLLYSFETYTTSAALYNLFLSIASSFFVEFWRREEARLRVVWGIEEQLRMHNARVVCPEFEGVVKPADYDHNCQTLVPRKGRRCLGVIVAVSCEAAYICMILCIIGPQFAFQVAHPKFMRNYGTLVSFIIALECQVFKNVWKNIAVKLVPLEQLKYQRDADQSLDRKIIPVYFVSLFAPLVYATLVIPFAGKICSNAAGVVNADADCLTSAESEAQLVSVFLNQFFSEVLSITKDFVVPLFYYLKNQLLEGTRVAQNAYESQYFLVEYDGFYLSQDYIQVIFPMAFVFIWGSICPLLTALTWLSIACSQRSINRWKLLHLYRRPMPVVNGNIGEHRIRFLYFVASCATVANWGYLVMFLPYFQQHVPSTSHKVILLLVGLYFIHIAEQLFYTFFVGSRKTALLRRQGEWQCAKVHSHVSNQQDRCMPYKSDPSTARSEEPFRPDFSNNRELSPDPPPVKCCSFSRVLPRVRWQFSSPYPQNQPAKSNDKDEPRTSSSAVRSPYLSHKTSCTFNQVADVEYLYLEPTSPFWAPRL